MTLSRRNLLRRAAGTGASLVFADVIGLTREGGILSWVGLANAATPARFYLYGLAGSNPGLGPSVHGGSSSARPIALSRIADELADVPVRSPDQTTLGLVSVVQYQSRTALTVSFVDITSGQVTRHGRVELSDLPSGTSLLVTPTFAADSVTLCLVLSITVPTDVHSITRIDPRTGGTETIQAATWVSHHALLYFDGRSGSFAGPFHLSDAPSLARVNVFADDRDLFLWTIDEPAAVLRSKDPGASAPVPRLSAFPLGSGTARFTKPAPGPWPVNAEPIVRLMSGDIGRVVYGMELQVYSAADGAMTTFPIPQLEAVKAKPAFATMEARPDGMLFLTKPGIGSAVLIDPAQSYRAIAAVTYPIPVHASGAPSSKAALSTAGDTVYVLGGADTDGVAAYDMVTGARKALYANGQQFSGIHQLSSGDILAVGVTAPRLTLLTPDLEVIGKGDTDMQIVAIL